MNTITFDELKERLKAFIRLRIDSGEHTERSLARLLQVSQPHLHNMLKGARHLSVDFADRALVKFSISVLDLIEDDEIWAAYDEKRPNWMVEVAKRKPATRSSDRDSDPRAAWRTGS